MKKEVFVLFVEFCTQEEAREVLKEVKITSILEYPLFVTIEVDDQPETESFLEQLRQNPLVEAVEKNEVRYARKLC
jgi:hypothetical protein